MSVTKWQHSSYIISLKRPYDTMQKALIIKVTPVAFFYQIRSICQLASSQRLPRPLPRPSHSQRGRAGGRSTTTSGRRAGRRRVPTWHGARVRRPPQARTRAGGRRHRTARPWPPARSSGSTALTTRTTRRAPYEAMR